MYKTGVKLLIFVSWSNKQLTKILGLQPRDKAAMLGVKTKEYFLEEFTWK